MSKAKNIAGILGITLAAIWIGTLGVKYLYLIKPVPSYMQSKISQTIDVEGHVDDTMPLRTQRLLQMIKNGEDHIYIRINSPGGFMKEGMEFVSVMREGQSLGVAFTCVVDGDAMSMALIIFSECDNRYAVIGSRLMWHSMGIMLMQHVNQDSVSGLLNFMTIKNEEIWAPTRIHFMPWYFIEHFSKETIHSATDLEQNGFRYLRVIRNYEVY